jgi:hypothetical protein
MSAIKSKTAFIILYKLIWNKKGQNQIEYYSIPPFEIN